MHIDFVKWLVLIKLFTLGTNARQASIEADASYPTMLCVFDSLRKSIVYQMSKTDKQLRGEIEADEAYFGGKRKGNLSRGTKNKTIVFGVLERNGKVHVDIVKNVKAETLLAGTIKKVRKGNIMYTDQWKDYSTLVFHGYKHHSVNHSKMFGRDSLHKWHRGVLELCKGKDDEISWNQIRQVSAVSQGDGMEIQSQGSRSVFIIGRLCTGGK